MPIIVDSTDPTPSGLGTSVATLVDRVRRQLRDWPDGDEITADVGAVNPLVHVADTSLYWANCPIQVDDEVMIVRSIGSGTTLSCKRGAFGTTAAVHASATSVLIKPRFYDVEIVDALADALDAAFPYIYYRVKDTSLSADGSVYEYTIPEGNNGIPIPYIYKVETQESGELTPWQVRNWMLVRDDSTSTPKLKFRITQPTNATIRIQGYDYFPRLQADSTLDPGWPVNMEYPLVMYACSVLLASGEFSRVSIDRGVIDDREQANKVGASMSASQYGLQWYLRRVQNSGFPPMSKHVRPVT